MPNKKKYIPSYKKEKQTKNTPFLPQFQNKLNKNPTTTTTGTLTSLGLVVTVQFAQTTFQYVLTKTKPLFLEYFPFKISKSTWCESEGVVRERTRHLRCTVNSIITQALQACAKLTQQTVRNQHNGRDLKNNVQPGFLAKEVLDRSVEQLCKKSFSIDWKKKTKTLLHCETDGLGVQKGGFHPWMLWLLAKRHFWLCLSLTR